MKIKVSKTFRKVLALVLCAIMVFGAAPLAGVLGFFPDASAESEYIATFFYYVTENGVSEHKVLEVPVEPGAPITPPTDIERIGYSLKADKAAWQPQIPDVMPAENVSFTAQWDINQYTITFDTDGGNAISAITKNYNDSVGTVADPVKEGSTFEGWIDTATDESVEIPVVMPAKDMNLKATWNVKKYTLSFDSNGGTPVESIETDYGADLTEYKTIAPTRTGYTFREWQPAIPDTMPEGGIKVTAQWTVNQYTITFDTYGGTELNEIKQDYDTEIVKPGNPKKDGYTFAGWDPIIPEKMPAEDMTITAQWSQNAVYLTFDPNGGTLVIDGTPTQNPVKPETAQGCGDVAVAPVTPTREGYTFIGWYDGLTEESNPMDKVPLQDTTYYALWKQGTGDASYSITYYYMEKDGVSWDQKGPFNYSEVAGAEIDLYDEIDADLEVGFYIDEEKSTPAGLKATAVADKNIEFHVYIARTEYTIEFNSNGGSDVKPISAVYGADITAPEPPVKTGYAFVGWKNNSTGVIESIPSSMPASNMKFTAQWETKTDTAYKVVIRYEDAKNGNVIAEKPYEFTGTTGSKIKILIDGTPVNDGTNYHKLSEFTLEHYKFDTTKMANQVLEGTVAADGSTVLTLIFAPEEYKVTFTVDGKEYKSTSVKYYTDANTVKPSQAEMDEKFAKDMAGYSFTGWTPTLSNVETDMVYVATYTANLYKIVFDYDKALIIDDEIVRENIDFWPNEGEELDAVTQAFNTDVKIPAYPEKDGYTCVAWLDNEGNEYKPGSTIRMPVTPADGLVLVAIFVANEYTITFDANLAGATLKTKSVKAFCDDYVEIVTCDASETDKLNMIPAKEGYTFLGWYDYTDKQNPAVYNLGDTLRVPANNLTLVAEWVVGEFLLIFKDDGKVVATYEDVASDETITAPKDYPKTTDYKNRTFLGWREEGKKAGDPLFVFNKMPGHSTVLEAVWGYTITFDLNTEDTSAKLASAKTVTKEISLSVDLAQVKNPTRTGYTFKGWYLSEKATGTPVTGKVDFPYDTTLYAGWQINTYTITFTADTYEGAGAGIFAGNVTKIISLKDFDEEITVPADPTKVGYTLAGWKDQDGNTVSEFPEKMKMPAKNVEYTAQWVINSYNVVFKDSDGSVIKRDTLEYGAPIVKPANPVRKGSTFLGWDKTVPATVPAENIVFTAKWQENTYTITFRDSDGTVLETVSGKYGSAVKAVDEPSKMFKNFTGWVAADGSAVEIPTTMPDYNMDVYASWENDTGFFDFIASLFASFFQIIIQLLAALTA